MSSPSSHAAAPTTPSSGALGSTLSGSLSETESGDKVLGSIDYADWKRVRAIFVDDNEEDREIADRFSSDGLFTTAIIPKGSLSELQDEILGGLTEGFVPVIIMDYRLDDRASAESPVFAHRAGALAAGIREHRGDVPIVLLTTEDNKIQAVESNQAISLLFDAVFLKDLVSSTQGRLEVAVAIVDLALGFEKLRGAYRSGLSWGDIGVILGMTEAESSTFDSEWPDVLPANFSSVVNSILRGLLAERPGLLLPLADAAGRAGISVESMRQVLQLNPFLEYSGPFAKIHHRVWRSRLDRALLLQDNEVGEADTRPDIGALYSASRALSAAEAANCVVCGKRRSELSCALCRLGVDRRHSIVSSEMIVPAWSQPRAICFRCIEDGTAEDERFPGFAQESVDDVKNGLGDPY